MTQSPLREWAKAAPFIPFTVTMSSGRHVRVTGPEMIILGKRWDTVAWIDEEGLDRTVLIVHAHITAIDITDAAQSQTPE